MDPFNPFLLGAYVSPHYFCDRENETKLLIEHLTNGRNVVLSSPRRLGKTGLLHHVFHQKQLTDNSYCVFFDAFPTNSLQFFTYGLSQAVFEQIKTKGLLGTVVDVIKSIHFGLKIDPQTGEPGVDFSFGSISNPELTLSELFTWLNRLDKPVFLALDEFQQVAKYRDRTVEALLRSLIQASPNVHVVYSGSELHLLNNMFFDGNRPFFQSAVSLTLKPIDRTPYCQFAQKLFSEDTKVLPKEIFNIIYDRAEGVTWTTHYLLNILYANLSPGETATDFDATKAESLATDYQKDSFLTRFASLSDPQKEILSAIVKEKQAKEVTSFEFIKRHSLRSASSVQSALRPLVERGIVTRNTEGYYRIYDVLFYNWLKGQLK